MDVVPADCHCAIHPTYVQYIPYVGTEKLQNNSSSSHTASARHLTAVSQDSNKIQCLASHKIGVKKVGGWESTGESKQVQREEKT